MTSLTLLKSTPSFSPPLPRYCLSTGFYQSFFRLLQRSPKLLLPKPVFPNAHVSIHTTVRFILPPGESFNCSHHSRNHGQLLLLSSQHPSQHTQHSRNLNLQSPENCALIISSSEWTVLSTRMPTLSFLA